MCNFDMLCSESTSSADSGGSYANLSVHIRTVPCVLSAGVVQPGVYTVLSQRGESVTNIIPMTHGQETRVNMLRQILLQIRANFCMKAFVVGEHCGMEAIVWLSGVQVGLCSCRQWVQSPFVRAMSYR